MRILHVLSTLSPESGGPPVACVNMATASAARGHEVRIFTTNWHEQGEMAAPLEREVRFRGVGMRFFPVQAPRALRWSSPLAEALAAALPETDVVHCHSLYFHHSRAVHRLCREHGVPFILRPHSTLDPYIFRRHRWRKRLVEWWFQDAMLRDAALIHYTSAEEQAKAERMVRAAPGCVVSNGVESCVAEPGDAERFLARFPELRGKRIVLFLGRINFKKGLDLLIPAFADLLCRDPDARLVIAGPDDGYLETARALIDAHGLGGKALLPGMLAGAQKRGAFAAAACFALTSYAENFGIAVAEAMSAGCPVLISDQVDIHGAVRTAGAGLVVPCDRAAIGAAMGELLGDVPLRERAGAAGRRLAEEAYSWERIAGDLQAMYERALAGAAARSAA